MKGNTLSLNQGTREGLKSNQPESKTQKLSSGRAGEIAKPLQRIIEIVYPKSSQTSVDTESRTNSLIKELDTLYIALQGESIVPSSYGLKELQEWIRVFPKISKQRYEDFSNEITELLAKAKPESHEAALSLMQNSANKELLKFAHIENFLEGLLSENGAQKQTINQAATFHNGDNPTTETSQARKAFLMAALMSDTSAIEKLEKINTLTTEIQKLESNIADFVVNPPQKIHEIKREFSEEQQGLERRILEIRRKQDGSAKIKKLDSQIKDQRLEAARADRFVTENDSHRIVESHETDQRERLAIIEELKLKLAKAERFRDLKQRRLKSKTNSTNNELARYIKAVEDIQSELDDFQKEANNAQELLSTHENAIVTSNQARLALESSLNQRAELISTRQALSQEKHQAESARLQNLRVERKKLLGKPSSSLEKAKLEKLNANLKHAIPENTELGLVHQHKAKSQELSKLQHSLTKALRDELDTKVLNRLKSNHVSKINKSQLTVPEELIKLGITSVPKVGGLTSEEDFPDKFILSKYIEQSYKNAAILLNEQVQPIKPSFKQMAARLKAKRLERERNDKNLKPRLKLKAETPKPAEVKAETPKDPTPKAVTPKPAEVKAETPKDPTPKAVTPKPAEVKAETPKDPTPKAVTPKPAEVKVETLKAPAPKAVTLKPAEVKTETQKAPEKVVQMSQPHNSLAILLSGEPEQTPYADNELAKTIINKAKNDTKFQKELYACFLRSTRCTTNQKFSGNSADVEFERSIAKNFAVMVGKSALNTASDKRLLKGLDWSAKNLAPAIPSEIDEKDIFAIAKFLNEAKAAPAKKAKKSKSSKTKSKRNNSNQPIVPNDNDPGSFFYSRAQKLTELWRNDKAARNKFLENKRNCIKATTSFFFNTRNIFSEDVLEFSQDPTKKRIEKQMALILTDAVGIANTNISNKQLIANIKENIHTGGLLSVIMEESQHQLPDMRELMAQGLSTIAESFKAEFTEAGVNFTEEDFQDTDKFLKTLATAVLSRNLDESFPKRFVVAILRANDVKQETIDFITHKKTVRMKFRGLEAEDLIKSDDINKTLEGIDVEIQILDTSYEKQKKELKVKEAPRAVVILTPEHVANGIGFTFTQVKELVKDIDSLKMSRIHTGAIKLVDRKDKNIKASISSKKVSKYEITGNTDDYGQGAKIKIYPYEKVLLAFEKLNIICTRSKELEAIVQEEQKAYLPNFGHRPSFRLATDHTSAQAQMQNLQNHQAGLEGKLSHVSSQLTERMEELKQLDPRAFELLAKVTNGFAPPKAARSRIDYKRRMHSASTAPQLAIDTRPHISNEKIEHITNIVFQSEQYHRGSAYALVTDLTKSIDPKRKEAAVTSINNRLKRLKEIAGKLGKTVSDIPLFEMIEKSFIKIRVMLQKNQMLTIKHSKPQVAPAFIHEIAVLTQMQLSIEHHNKVEKVHQILTSIKELGRFKDPENLDIDKRLEQLQENIEKLSTIGKGHLTSAEGPSEIVELIKETKTTLSEAKACEPALTKESVRCYIELDNIIKKCIEEDSGDPLECLEEVDQLKASFAEFIKTNSFDINLEGNKLAKDLFEELNKMIGFCYGFSKNNSNPLEDFHKDSESAPSAKRPEGANEILVELYEEFMQNKASEA